MPGKWDTSTKLTYLFASLAFEKETDRAWLKWRFDMLRDVLRDTWAYQEILQEGRKEGLQDQRLTLLEIVQSRFPSIEPLAKKAVEAINDATVLRRLIVKMSIAQTEEQAAEALLSVDQTGQKKKKK